MNETKTIHMPPQECPVCGQPFDGRIMRYACSPPIDEYPCGCRVRYVVKDMKWEEGKGWTPAVSG